MDPASSCDKLQGANWIAATEFETQYARAIHHSNDEFDRSIRTDDYIWSLLVCVHIEGGAFNIGSHSSRVYQWKRNQWFQYHGMHSLYDISPVDDPPLPARKGCLLHMARFPIFILLTLLFSTFTPTYIVGKGVNKSCAPCPLAIWWGLPRWYRLRVPGSHSPSEVRPTAPSCQQPWFRNGLRLTCSCDAQESEGSLILFWTSLEFSFLCTTHPDDRRIFTSHFIFKHITTFPYDTLDAPSHCFATTNRWAHKKRTAKTSNTLRRDIFHCRNNKRTTTSAFKTNELHVPWVSEEERNKCGIRPNATQQGSKQHLMLQ